MLKIKSKYTVPKSIASALGQKGVVQITSKPAITKLLNDTSVKYIENIGYDKFILVVNEMEAFFTLADNTHNVTYNIASPKLTKSNAIASAIDYVIQAIQDQGPEVIMTEGDIYSMANDDEGEQGPEGTKGVSFGKLIKDKMEKDTAEIVNTNPESGLLTTQETWEAANKKPINPHVGVNPHDKILHDIGIDDGAVALPDAKEFYQRVLSSDPGSRYVLVAKQKKGKARIAVRLKGDTLSIRLAPYAHSEIEAAEILGLNDHGNYASAHFECSGNLALKRYTAMLRDTLCKWDVAKFDEDKIRKNSA